MRSLRPWLSVMLPGVASTVGVVWMIAAVQHYEMTTGREFYGLAGYHYSVPEWGFAYHAGGDTIHRRTTTIPARLTFFVLVVSLVIAAVVERRSKWSRIAMIVVIHLLTAVVFILIVAYVEINVTGVFI